MIFISIGPTCYTSCLLKEYGYRFEAYPLDWVFSSLEAVEHCIRDEFREFLNVENLYDVSGSSARHAVYNPMINTANLWGHYLEHEGDAGANRGEAQWKFFNHHDLRDEATLESFRRRCARFMDALRGEEDVYLVYLNRNTNDCEAVVDFTRRMRFRDGVFVIGIMEDSRAPPEAEILHVEKGCLVCKTSAPSAALRHYVVNSY